MNGQKMATEVLSAIKGHVGSVVEMLRAEFAERIKLIPVVPGPEGPRGQQGIPGSDGADGKPGASGPEGAKGADGKDGLPGKDGRDGVDGKDGINGKDGAPGLVGKDGMAGADGRDGQRGEDGKDALDIEPITNLEKGRSYSRGTWATYKGSLIRAQRTTDAFKDANPLECGWALMVEGNSFEDMKVKHDGKRGVTFKWVKGCYEIEATITIPCVVDAGFYRDGMDIEKGDGVTFGGSYWIAQKATTTKPELGNPDWRLAVKKGRDGKASERIETRPVLQVP